MSTFTLVDPQGWEWDLQSVYSAYIGYFQLHGIPWYDRSWGHLFTSFEEFLEYSWPAIVVTDAWTGRAHIATRTTSIGSFLKMIKTRYGEVLPHVDNILRVSPFETVQRPLRTVSDWQSYKKLHASLPAAVLSAVKARVRAGEPEAIQKLWDPKDKTFLAFDFEWSERNLSTCLEWGYAAVRCGHLDAIGVWPPVPEHNYRKGHYIVAEYVDKIHNKHCPTRPWEYAFGDSQVVPKAKLPQVIQAIITSLASPDSETITNNVVLVAHGASGDIERLNEMKIKLPSNMLVLDTATYERQLFATGRRGAMADAKTGAARAPGSTLSLGNMLRSLRVVPPCALHNAGNDALLCLLALQGLLEHAVPPVPPVRDGAGGGAPMLRLGGLRIAAPPPALGRSPLGTPTDALPPVLPVAYSLGARVVSGTPLGGSTPSPRDSPLAHGKASPTGYFDPAGKAATMGASARGRFKQTARRGQSVEPGRSARRRSTNADVLLSESVQKMTLR